ncbi:MAG: hypothetical protein K9I85_13160, partial [Saprospiraceae bacterium]|nr:hypothetical protein [Saprospiraceae bacterium]
MITLDWTDNCDGTGSVTGTDASDGNTCPEIITRTWTYTDACGNASTESQIITINDDTPPFFDAPPAAIAVQCSVDVPAMIDLDWTDNCDGVGSVTGTDASDGNTCPEIITRSWTYTDACGNASTETQIITIGDDTPPVFDAPPTAIAIQCTADIPSMIDLAWTDNCDGAGTVTGTDASDGNTCPEIITRTWTYTDACGNASTETQIITIGDDIPPVFDAPPAALTIQCSADIPAMIDLDWTDNCDGAGSVTGTDTSDGNTCPEVITRTWTYTDACGNASTETQIITINDDIPPVFDTPPVAIAIQCIADLPTMIDLAWTDNCDGTGSVTGTDASDGNTCPEIITRTWTYTDACGNASSETQIITINDDTPPVFDTPPAAIAVQCIADLPAMIILAWTD